MAHFTNAQRFRSGTSLVLRVLATALGLWACLWAVGCGGGASREASYAGVASPSPMAAPEAPEEPSEADEAAIYRPEAKSAGPIAPGRATGGAMAQQAPAKDAAKKEEPERERRPDSGTTPPGDTRQGESGGEKQQAGPLLIYTANLTMAVFETRKSIDAVEKLAKDSGGYLVSREDNRITIRVPSGKFEGAIDKIGKIGDLLHRNVSVQDVTDQYYDLQVRMRNLEVMRERFEELLKQAKNVPDALAVERELERVVGELERMKGRLKLLKELIAYSTITVEFQPRPTDHVDSKVRLPFPWLDQLGLGELLRL